MSPTDIAKVCHEANRAYCATLGDHSQVAWEDAPEWQQTSAVKGVEFNIANPNAPASASHDSWLAVKQAEGWKYGPVKAAEKKEHPCFVPYEQLPLEQRLKDHLFKAIVAALGAECAKQKHAQTEIQPAPTEPIMRFFGYAHLKPEMQHTSRLFHDVAQEIVAKLPRNAERSVALRKLLEAKDAAVRASLPE